VRRHLGAADDALPCNSFGIAEEKIFGDRHVEDDARIVSILRHHSHAGASHGPRPSGVNFFAIDDDISRGESNQRRKQVSERSLPIALDPGDPKDFSLVDGQGEGI